MLILRNPEYERDLAGLCPPPAERLAEAEAVTRSRSTVVHLLDWSLGGEPCRVFVKEYRVAGKRRRVLKALVRPRSLARKAWEGCLGLRERGFEAAEPLACVEPADWRTRREGLYFICREIRGATPWHEAAAGCDLEALERLMTATARWLARLHAAGIDHGDLQARNILLREREGDWRFTVIDYDRVRFCRFLRWRRRARALASVIYELDAALTPDRLDRYLAAYLEVAGPGRRYPLVRRLMAATVRRFVRRGRRRRGLPAPPR